MAYTREELFDKLKASYASQNVDGELALLVSGILADYLYLHQMEDVSILMEDSFLRSKLLSSKIQHAADNFCSVGRGKNRIIQIENLGCLKASSHKKFETVATYGQYKMIYADDAISNPDEPCSFRAYLSVDVATTLTIQGNGKYYIDLEDADGNLIQDISEDITVASMDDGGTIDESDDVYHEFKISSVLTDLYEKNTDTNTATTGGNGMKAEICAMTLPGYGVRLWKAEPFEKNFTYIVKFLKCPDPAKPELDITKAIRSIPGYTMNPNGTTTTITVPEGKQQVLRTDDADEIYLLAANKQKFQSTMKSINSIDEIIQEVCKKFTGFNTVIDGNVINVYYCSTEDLSDPDNNQHRDGTGEATIYTEELNNIAKAYNITQDFVLTPADPVSLDPIDLYVDVYYSDLITIADCETIINAPQAVVGKDFNPYQIIADLMSNEKLLGKISRVQVYQMTGNDQTYPGITSIADDKHIYYNPKISYISTRV